MSNPPELIPGEIYELPDMHGNTVVFRVRAFQHWPKPGYENVPGAVKRTSVLYDEIGPSGGFSWGSPAHYQVKPHVLDPDEDANVWMNEQSIADLRRMKDYWMEEAVKYQNLAHERRPLWEKVFPPIMFIFVVIPYRLWSYYVRGYRGPWS